MLKNNYWPSDKERMGELAREMGKLLNADTYLANRHILDAVARGIEVEAQDLHYRMQEVKRG